MKSDCVMIEDDWDTVIDNYDLAMAEQDHQSQNSHRQSQASTNSSLDLFRKNDTATMRLIR